MNDYRKIQTSTLGTKIGYHDTVSGAFFHRFVKEYHAYDRRQKELILQLQTVIAQLQADIEQLSKERDQYKNALASVANYTSTKKRGDAKGKIRRQQAAISQLMLANISLKEKLREITIREFK